MISPRLLDKPSPNHNVRPRDAVIDMLVIHYTGMKTMKAALDRLRDPESEVSAHYLIDEDGSVYRLVDEKRRAWHAGISFWQGRDNLNDCSIGIELVNPGHDFGYPDFPPEQMEALKDLALDIIRRRAIPAHRILAHSDIAPVRKQDPGEKFNWRWLASNGIGLWPDDEPVSSADDTMTLLQRYGYQTDNVDQEAVITAFQRHFYPDHVTGYPDDETIRRLLRLMTQKEKIDALEKYEDIQLSQLAESREKNVKKWGSHKDTWRQEHF